MSVNGLPGWRYLTSRDPDEKLLLIALAERINTDLAEAERKAKRAT